MALQVQSPLANPPLLLSVVGYLVHDSDRAVHEMLAPNGQVVRHILACFPAATYGDIGSEDSGINRPALGKIVFNHPELRELLEEIIHPLVYQHRQKFVVQARQSRQRAVMFDVRFYLRHQASIYVTM